MGFANFQATDSIRRENPMGKCLCLVPDENDNCIDCGKHIDLPDVGELPNLGDIPGICKLIDETATTYEAAVKENTDPKDPSLPRLRFVGSKMIRLPHKALLTKTLKPAYKAAKALGYKGTFERWGELVQEHAPGLADTHPHWTLLCWVHG